MTISLIAVCLFCWSQKPKNESESNGYENDSVGRIVVWEAFEPPFNLE